MVRAEMGWNYDQAERATGLNSETWRLWEKRKRRCTDIETASRAISGSSGISFEWLMIGGGLDTTPIDPNDTDGIRRKSPWIYDSSVTLGTWETPATPLRIAS